MSRSSGKKKRIKPRIVWASLDETDARLDGWTSPNRMEAIEAIHSYDEAQISVKCRLVPIYPLKMVSYESRR